MIAQMGLAAQVEMIRPGHPPAGQGIIRLAVPACQRPLHPLIPRRGTAPARVWGISRLARQLLAEVDSGATIDRHASDQIIPFASLADGISSFQVPFITGHTETAGWLASLFLRAEVGAAGTTLAVHGRDAHCRHMDSGGAASARG